MYEVAKRVQLPTNQHLLETKLLSRTRHTRPQTDLNRADRLQNVTNAFSCRTDAAPPALIILDDVCTTGSTLKAAQTACKQSYPQVPIIKLALAG